MCSVFYDPNLQPKLGDEYLVVDYKQSDEIYQGIAILGEYIVKCLNRKLPVWNSDENSIYMYVFWMDELIRKNKICKIK